jgi:uncharacterized membrane protein
LHQPPDILLFLGRFHPLLVHLPIGMLAALAILELVARFPRCKNAAASAGFLLALAVPLAVVTAICGWLLSLAGGYDDTLLAWHKWLGTGTAVASVVTAFFFQRGKVITYHISLFITVGLLMVAGHLGGSLTHGSDYLIRYAPSLIKRWLGLTVAENVTAANSAVTLSQLPVFAGVVEPIFAKNCVACHGPQKAKGDLRLDTFAAVQKGGKDGSVIAPGMAMQSLLIQRVLLPVSDDDHMPPDGKPPLTAAEIAVLKWWIDAGANETNTLDQLQPPPEIRAALSAK